MQLIRDIVQIYGNYGYTTEVLAASIRHPMHIVDSALAGATTLVRLDSLGFPGAADTLEHLRHDFLRAVGDSRTASEAEKEWQRIIDGAEKVVASTPSTTPPWEDRATGTVDHLLGATIRHLPVTAQAAEEPTRTPMPPTAIPDSLPPPVPIDAFPPWIADQITNVARQLGCDPVLPAVFALGALSVASLGHIQVKLRAGETLRSTGLYLAAAGVPATGKSPALDFMMGPVREHEQRTIAHAAQEVARAEAKKLFGKAALLAGRLPKHKHGITNHAIGLWPFWFTASGEAKKKGWEWVSLARSEKLPLASAEKKLLSGLKQALQPATEDQGQLGLKL
jgi:hypothetical protein